MSETDLASHRLTRSIVAAFYEVYNELGFGFLEALYSAALERELLTRGFTVSREFGVMVTYKGEELGFQRLDMVVDGTVVVEIKATQALSPIALRQLRNYLRGTNLEVGLLLHFGPEARFYRVFAPRKPADRPETGNPVHPA